MDKKRLVASAAAVVLALGVGSGIAYATGGSPEQPTGPNIEKAKGVALGQTNGGRVTGTEVEDEEGFYEVEVTEDDGSQVEIHLDRDFDVLGTSADQESPDGKDTPNDD